MKNPTLVYLEKAIEAEERASEATDSQIKARWLGIAFGYRELARYRIGRSGTDPLTEEVPDVSLPPEDMPEPIPEGSRQN